MSETDKNINEESGIREKCAEDFVGKTLYVTDLDGTLMRNDETLSAYTVQTINELIDKGLAFTYATARSIESARPIAGGIHLRLPAITRNGAVLADNRTGKHLEKAVFTAAEVEMLKKIPELPYYGFVSCFLGEVMHRLYYDGPRSEELQGYVDYYAANPTVRPVATVSELFCGEPGYVTLVGAKEEIRPIYERVREYKGWETLFQKDTYRDEYWLEICPQNCTKAKSIRKLKERYGFSRLVVFGDGLNDIPMFEIADEAYAVANALPELKEHATGLIGCNEEDAVANYLKEQMQKSENTKDAAHENEIKAGNKPVKMPEIWDLYNRNLEIIGEHVRGTEMPEEGYHMVVHIWIRNAAGQYLMTQRSANKKTYPLAWECVGGSVLKGEASLPAAIREVQEEVGIILRPEDGRKVLTQIREYAGGNRVNDINDVYLFAYDGPILLAEASTDEVEQARWMTREEIAELYRQGKMVSVIKDLSYFLEDTDGVFA